MASLPLHQWVHWFASCGFIAILHRGVSGSIIGNSTNTQGTQMQYRRLGRSGLQVSQLSLGSWVSYHNQVDSAAAREIMAAAMEAGVNFFDNAEGYA